MHAAPGLYPRLMPLLRCRPAHALPHPRALPLLSCLLPSRCHRRSRSRRVNRKPPSRASPRGIGDVPQPPPTRTHMARPFTWPSGWRCALCASSRCSYPLRGIRPGPLRLGATHSGTPHTTRGHAPLCVLRPVPRRPQEILHLALSNFVGVEFQQAPARCIRLPFSISPRSMPVRAFRYSGAWPARVEGDAVDREHIV